MYVEDLLIASSSGKTIEYINIKLYSRFKMKDFGKASVALGIETHNDSLLKPYSLSNISMLKRSLKCLECWNQNALLHQWNDK